MTTKKYTGNITVLATSMTYQEYLKSIGDVHLVEQIKQSDLDGYLVDYGNGLSKWMTEAVFKNSFTENPTDFECAKPDSVKPSASMVTMARADNSVADREKAYLNLLKFRNHPANEYEIDCDVDGLVKEINNKFDNFTIQTAKLTSEFFKLIVVVKPSIAGFIHRSIMGELEKSPSSDVITLEVSPNRVVYHLSITIPNLQSYDKAARRTTVTLLASVFAYQTQANSHKVDSK